MKQLLMTLLTIGLVSFATACGNGDVDGTDDMNETNETAPETEVADNPIDETPNNNEEQVPMDSNQENMTSQMEALGYHDISVEVEYSDNQEYEFKVEQEENGTIEAKLENDLADEHLSGQEAFDYLYPLLETLEINSESTNQEVIDKIVTTFDLPTDYIKIEVEIDFNDGTKVDIEHRN